MSHGLPKWIVVGNEVSGDEDTVWPTEAFGLFDSEEDAQEWVDTASTFDGQVLEVQDWRLGRVTVDS